MDVAIIVGVVLLIAAVAGVVALRSRSSTTDLAPGSPVTKLPTAVSLRERLGKTRRALGERLGAVLGGAIDAATWDELEESLIAADMGVATSGRIVAAVRDRKPADGSDLRAVLVEELRALFADGDRGLVRTSKPSVILVVGVNGAGKTTTIAKLASILKSQGAGVLLGSADTFRAAADTQLRTWADRVGVPVVGGGGATDPASVAFDAIQSARARDSDVLIIDTAGRLQAKTNLMEELEKVARIVEREAGIDEVLLVVDGTAGQNALSQAQSFAAAVGVTGLVLTKLDGSARGGVAVAIEQELGIPVKYIGVGEGVEHLVPFDPDDFVDALVGE